ncbi:hypothetical protein [Enterococcus malodoratus]|uniref:Carbohydrate kinase FGGY N-terminal domain-containing protein n=1 Tax=Enterococcus malodoratus ATCC 43197 TaxID=1158601 RepID=R2QUD2_9ENTE|nr:hypothetical protein [Enterococcus malodoratus]EOH72111.1 hypothetical protein UAI_04395 [Enterococcus malodoratus ATCC 43197]EOT69865.1 hypothetical protein I585_01344 [Enterococcus malodoratus ATCC 43197]OJG56441.1 hypothetical protein RV07_GL004133 [Enterococcus malodoratus]STC70783.1 Uncharacterised protein [Enterococcus malodoratus]
MKEYTITIDGGTSKTKVCLWNGEGQIVNVQTRNVGARDCAIQGNTTVWKRAIHQMVLLQSFK